MSLTQQRMPKTLACRRCGGRTAPTNRERHGGGVRLVEHGCVSCFSTLWQDNEDQPRQELKAEGAG